MLGDVSAELRIGEPVRVSDMTGNGNWGKRPVGAGWVVVVGRLLTGTGAVGISGIGIFCWNEMFWVTSIKHAASMIDNLQLHAESSFF